MLKNFLICCFLLVIGFVAFVVSLDAGKKEEVVKVSANYTMSDLAGICKDSTSDHKTVYTEDGLKLNLICSE